MVDASVVPMLVRDESESTFAAIHAVHALSFPTDAEARLVDALRASGRLTISLVAVDGDNVAGHVAFSPVTIDGEPVGFGLGPIAVRPEYRRRGVAARLVERGLDRCRSLATALVVVLGDPRYYARFGFRPARLRGLRDEYDGGDAFQALELSAGRVPGGGGLVKYSAEFASVGV